MTQQTEAGAIGIVRVSSEAQVDKYGPATQRDDIARRADRLGVALVDVLEYQESATVADKRPQFEALLEQLLARGAAGEVEKVIFGRPDRLGRDGEAAFFYYIHLLEQAGLEVRFGRDDIDPGDTFRNFKLFLYAFKAKQDADTIRTNTMNGRRKRGEAGKIPNGQVPWPYDYETKAEVGARALGLPTINPERAAWVRRWVDWLLTEKTTLGELARRMRDAGVLSPRGSLNWSRSTFKRILSNRGLLGEFYACNRGREPHLIHQDPALAIMTHREFEAIQQILRENKVLSVRNTKRDYTPLHGFVWCHCGRKAAPCPQRGKPYYRCNVCRDHVVRAQGLWETARAQLAGILTKPEQVLPALTDHLNSKANKQSLEMRRGSILGELRDLDSALERTIRMFAILDGFGEDKVRAEVERIKRRRSALEHDLEEVDRGLRADAQTRLSVGQLQAVSRRLSAVLEAADRQEWRALLREFGFKVILQRDPPHVMRVSVNVEDTASALLQPS